MNAGLLTDALPAIHAAQAAWGAQPLSRRGHYLKRIGKAFAQRAQAIVDTVALETRKNEGDAWFADVVPNLDLFSYWTGPGLAAIKPRTMPLSRLKFPKKRAKLSYEPRGIIGLISPWNYPVALPLRTLVPALMAGNAVLFKPSEVTPQTGELIAEIFNAVLPPGLVTVVQGSAEAGEAVIDQADHVVFIGSVATGRKVAMRCAEQLKEVSLELGGKDAAIVCADCHFERTLQGVFWGATSNSGQNCAAIERVYVERSLYPRFVDGLVRLAGQANVAPVATDAQDAIVKAHLQDALARGATAHGSYPGAVVLTDVPDDALVLNEETFGPLIPVIPVPSAGEGLRRANAVRFGLTTSIWTTNHNKGQRLATHATTGTVTVNNCSLTAAMPFAPWSGRGESGGGVTNSHLAILDMVHPKFTLFDANSDPEAWWYPMSHQASALARDSVAWLTAEGTAKIAQTVALLRAMKQRISEQSRWFNRAR